MRIAYLTLYFTEHHAKGGVGEKIKTQKKIWQTFGHTVNIFFLSPKNIEFEGSKSFQYAAFSNLPIAQFFTRFISRSYALYRMIKAIKKFQPDLIYLRHGMYIYPLHMVFRIAPVILEINSDDLSEAALQGGMVYWFTRLTRKISLTLCKGIIFVSHELAKGFYLYLNKKPYCVISNGIDLESILPLPPPNNLTPIISIAGSPAGSAWHGADKLILLAKQYPDITINVIGINKLNDTENLSNIHWLGFLTHAQTREILAQSDVACGTLALHRKNMQEASPLKVREAAAYGIPLILAYQDTDLSDIESDCILRLPNTEENIFKNSSVIRMFAYAMRGRRLSRELLHARIDQTQKEKERERFFIKIVASR